MAAIAEALVATAVGLAVAIPAVVAFNVLSRHSKAILANTEALSRVLMAHSGRATGVRGGHRAARRESACSGGRLIWQPVRTTMMMV